MYDYYESLVKQLNGNKNAPHLIGEFLAEVNNATHLLRQNPEHFQKRYREVRIIFIKTFPFSFYYTIENKTILVHAVLHTKRDPKTGIEKNLEFYRAVRAVYL